MSYMSEPIRPTRRTVCNVLRKSTNWKCLILTILIFSCLGAIIWCRNTRVTKILLDFNALPITSKRQVSPCEDGYVYIPIAFVIMLYLLYLVECWHSNARIQLSLEKIDVNSVYRKIHDMKESQPCIWWKAICYHYVRRVRQTTRYRNGETLTSSQPYYERVNTNAVGSSFFYNMCGMKDYSKVLVDLEKYTATKVRFTKGFVFANITTASEFEEQRSTFFREQERLDDYMEMREGLEFSNIHFNETLVAWTHPECPPWYGRINIFWVFSLLLFSWPIRILLELNTAHLHYKVTKLFGVNYPSDPTLVELQRPLCTSNYLQHIQQNSRRHNIVRLPHTHNTGQTHRHSHRNRLSTTATSRTPRPSINTTTGSSSTSSPYENSEDNSSTTEHLLPPENAFPIITNYSSNNNNNNNSLVMESSRKPESCQSKPYGIEFESHYQPYKNTSVSTWSNFTSSFFRRRSAFNRNSSTLLPRSVTLMIEPLAGRSSAANGCNKAGLFSRNCSAYSNSMILNDDGDDDDDGNGVDDDEILVPSYSEALLLLEPNPVTINDHHISNSRGNGSSCSRRNQQPNYDQSSNSVDSSQTNEVLHGSSDVCMANGSTYHQRQSSSFQRHGRQTANHEVVDDGDEIIQHGQDPPTTATLPTQSPSSSSYTALPTAVEIDFTHHVISSFPPDPRRAAAAQRQQQQSQPQPSSTSLQNQIVSTSVDQELPPSYIEALQTSRPVFISTFTRLRRCFTERDLAGGISEERRRTSHHHDYVRDRIQRTWFNYYSRTNPTFLQRFRGVVPASTANCVEDRRSNNGQSGSNGNNDITKV